MIRTVLIDDDPMEITALSRSLADLGEVNIIRTYTNPAMLLSELDDLVPDAVFIDIEMGMANGLDVAEKLLSRQPALHIVFVSGQPEYAFRAFEIGATDYILKPVTALRMQKSIQRIHMRLPGEESVALPVASPSALSVHASGELQVSLNGTPLTFKTAKVKELFAYFIVHKQIPVHRDVLIESLWPDQPYKKAKIYLHTCLSHLRKTLELAGQSETIRFSDQHYTFDPKPMDLDLDVFMNAAASGDVGQMEKAVRLYGGRLLEREGYSWAELRSEDLHRQMLLFLDRLISYYQEDLDRALEYLHLQQIHDPYLDRSVRNAMLILVQQGNRMEALRLYEQHVRMLDEDLGIDPDTKLTELYQLLTG